MLREWWERGLGEVECRMHWCSRWLSKVAHGGPYSQGNSLQVSALTSELLAWRGGL